MKHGDFPQLCKRLPEGNGWRVIDLAYVEEVEIRVIHVIDMWV